jgi:hypothetical protein
VLGSGAPNGDLVSIHCRMELRGTYFANADRLDRLLLNEVP